ncbi:MAG TPA: alcohol dehydrogenase catalytic domain-containing protein [Roseiarcus sp.]|nr:alcohol dehydrogenase catalytic domain-containing protein [Roseiarcus sp.]
MSEAVFLLGARDVRVSASNLRERRNHETLLDVAAVGICGSDLHYYKDAGIGSLQIRAPFVPGHEFGGYLCEDIPELGLKRGALVAVDPNRSCGQCEWCLAGHRNLCPNVEFIGAPPFDGAMTNQIWVAKSQVTALPESMGALEAAMLEPLGVAIHAVDLAKPRLLERVALLGAGPIGLLILQALKVAAAGDIHVIEPLEHRRAAALELGAETVVATVDDFIRGDGSGGCPLVIEATNSPYGFRDAVRASRIGGRVVLAGIPDGDTYTLPAAEARRRGLKVKFVRRMGDDYPRAIRLVSSGRVNVKAVVTHRVGGLRKAPELFEALAQSRPGFLKVLLYPNGESGRA